MVLTRVRFRPSGVPSVALLWGTLLAGVSAQESLSKGVVTVTFRPDGFNGVVTVDIPKDGVADGRPERFFFLWGVPKEFVQTAGPGSVELVRSGVLHVRIEKSEDLMLVKGDADIDADARVGARIIRVTEMIAGWATPPDSLTPRGTPGTGRVTQERIDEPLSPRKR